MIVKNEVNGVLFTPPESKGLKSGLVTLEHGGTVKEHANEDGSELLFILKGCATVHCDNEEADVQAGGSVLIPECSLHFVENKTPEKLVYLWVAAIKQKEE